MRSLRALGLGALVAAAVAGGCGGGDVVERGSLPLTKDFEDCAGFTSNDEVATVDCPDDGLRIAVSQPDVSPVHFVPFRFEPTTDDLTVEAAVRKTKGANAHGLGCDSSGPGEATRGYLFMLVRGPSPHDGTASILRLEQAPGETPEHRFAQGFQTLKAKEGAVHGPGTYRIRADCDRRNDGSVQLTMTIDGKRVVRVTDPNGIGAFQAALASVIAESPGTEVVFDDLAVAKTPS